MHYHVHSHTCSYVLNLFTASARKSLVENALFGIIPEARWTISFITAYLFAQVILLEVYAYTYRIKDLNGEWVAAFIYSDDYATDTCSWVASTHFNRLQVNVSSIPSLHEEITFRIRPRQEVY
jgi:hypothetical protein